MIIHTIKVLYYITSIEPDKLKKNRYVHIINTISEMKQCSDRHRVNTKQQF